LLAKQHAHYNLLLLSASAMPALKRRDAKITTDAAQFFCAKHQHHDQSMPDTQ
jgi:hypothetical protein